MRDIQGKERLRWHRRSRTLAIGACAFLLASGCGPRTGDEEELDGSDMGTTGRADPATGIEYGNATTPVGAGGSGSIANGQPVQGSAGGDTLHTVALQGEGDRSSATRGEVAVLPGRAESTLSLSLEATGLPPGDHAWHIHRGPCGSSADVVIALSATDEMEAALRIRRGESEMAAVVGPLEVEDDGSVEETVEVPGLSREMIGRGGYSLHIHQRPGTDHGPSIACASL